jgi:hypothetical protein
MCRIVCQCFRVATHSLAPRLQEFAAVSRSLTELAVWAYNENWDQKLEAESDVLNRLPVPLGERDCGIVCPRGAIVNCYLTALSDSVLSDSDFAKRLSSGVTGS